MIKKQLFGFIVRWAASSLGMWLCISWFGQVTDAEVFSEPWLLYVVAGLIFSIINSIVKPLITVFALPLAILTMGISTVIINVAMVALVVYLLPGVEMDLVGFIFSSIIMSIINDIINAVV